MWLFPWSVYLPAVVEAVAIAPTDRAGKHAPAGAVLDRLRPGLLHVFDHAGILFDALLSGAGAADRLGDGGRAARGSAAERACSRVILAAAAWPADRCGSWYASVPTPGDISTALSQNPDAYTLSLGHIEDLTIEVLRVSSRAAVVGRGRVPDRRRRDTACRRQRAFLAAAVMAVLFFQAARMALVVFDPFMSSRPLAEAH